MKRICLSALFLLNATSPAWAGAGDVATKTDHPWYPGELSCSTFERLFQTQAQVYQRATGRRAETDQDKALASWFWRNTHYYHAIEGASDLWGDGLGRGRDRATREYWKGLFADGFGLCFTTHAQWLGEMQALLGPGRSRCCGVPGHTSLEVYLTGGPYGQGRWTLLDHDISTVYFTPDGSRLMSLAEVSRNLDSLKGRTAGQNGGWLPGGLHRADPQVFNEFQSVSYGFGYAGVPPIVYLRSGESIRRYLAPGLEDGKTFVFWGQNYLVGRIPGPHRDRTWVNQPENMHHASRDAGSRQGQWYGNAVYTYRPDFAGGKYREAAIEDAADHVTLEFYTPYVIGCTPANLAAENEPKAIYESGAKNGLVVEGARGCPISVSADQGKTWNQAETAAGRMDLTDFVKGRQQYWLRFHAPATALAGREVTIRTVCQCSLSIVPRVKAGTNRVTYRAGGLAYLSAGPDLSQAEAHVVEGAIGTRGPVTLELRTPRGEKAVHLYAAQRQASGNPPRDVKYNIDYSFDAGRTWRPVVNDMPLIRHDPEPGDIWSQSHIWGDVPLPSVTSPVRVRFDPAGTTLQRCEAHLVYQVENTSPVRVAYAWKEAGEFRQATHTYRLTRTHDEVSSWAFEAREDPRTLWVEYAAE